MLIRKTAYYDSFRCIASDCPDSCCKEWDVQIDETSAAFYRSLPGALGGDLRAALREEDGETVMTITDGRCPMWRRDGLCRIQAELGEAALCKTCREFPRLTHDYGDFIELGLELSCPEAARLILSAEPQPLITIEDGDPGEGDYDADAMEILLQSREELLSLLADESRPVGDALALMLLFGCQVQAVLDGGETEPFDVSAALEDARDLAIGADPASILPFFRDLEILNPKWAERLEHPTPSGWHRGFYSLMRYFTERYWLQAVSDYDVYSRAKLAVIACLLIRTLGGDFLSTAQQFSKEIENDADNLDAVLDAAYTDPAFTDRALLGMLLQEGDCTHEN